MKKTVLDWFDKYFGSSEALLLSIILLASLLIFMTFGGVLGPLLVSIVITFLLQGMVNKVCSFGISRSVAMSLSYIVFIVGMISLLVGFIPLVGRQMRVLVGETPSILANIQDIIASVPEKYADYVTVDQFNAISVRVTEELGEVAEQLFALSISSFPGLLSIVIYLILVPLLVFFMLKDKDLLVSFFSGLLPSNRPVLNSIWLEMEAQCSNYIRGKFIEIILVGFTSLIAFMFLDLKYAALLAMLVGLSVLVPYIGATLVTIPVLMVGYAQWGWGPEFLWLSIIYVIIQFLDGNLLVPLLFSEVVNLHPVAIISAVLIFGGVWGFWGVFFAIPLATLVNAVYKAWPVSDMNSAPED
ncbi:MAG: AI-2E family transporter [Cellvibrionales bacterium TMED49]|nr:AI-2E family transporter [Porticoccaceae bacterium]OUU37027.1 MAG: AI-2E family transporter [Cellvibrionales bacterium TMED49]